MKKKILGIGAAVLILSAAVFAGCGLTGTRIRFGAAGLGGTYHAFADTFAFIRRIYSDGGCAE